MLKEVSVEVIRRCPNNCLHCSSQSDRHCSEILDYHNFTNIARDVAALGARTICLSGGEPFLHDRIADMIKFAASLGLQTFVYTSGIVFDEMNRPTSIGEKVLNEISPCVAKLIFNIEAALPSTYDKIMGTTGCFEVMKRSVRAANRFAIASEAHFVPMKSNVGEVDAVVNLCEELHISKLSFLRLVLHGRALDNKELLYISEEDLKNLKIELQKLKKRTAIDIRIGVPLSGDSLCAQCEAAKGKLNIKYDGYVYPCEVFKNDRISRSLDDVRPESVYEKTLMEIYNGSEYLKRVRALSEKFSGNGQCETCIGQYLLKEEGC